MAALLIACVLLAVTNNMLISSYVLPQYVGGPEFGQHHSDIYSAYNVPPTPGLSAYAIRNQGRMGGPLDESEINQPVYAYPDDYGVSGNPPQVQIYNEDVPSDERNNYIRDQRLQFNLERAKLHRNLANHHKKVRDELRQMYEDLVKWEG